MKKILLVCNAGMSTSMLVQKMIKVAGEKGIEVTIEAIPSTDLSKCWQSADVILLGPQIGFMKDSVKETVENKISVEVISMVDYGRMNADKVLTFAIDLMK
ncbi:PTS sugar transporter subunit IIB [Clostridium beijerinckii]|jgi:PTS system cellobiose-specific IIB component|uniref:PTS sugar transporter subunit IIB n=1 Tax=Clostridium beijerinckii TaxID=1520 RepID=A0AAW3W521_CLOBE|nr:PTS sugar transporter subunit IIB [Clostridium beijerinckii]MBC2456730.1 PTS sugar transporter subunit IIB [Clostridium beijerinckii]MBC2474030.1 PTS sugar transporter subunit IIB [Clostridium beijerinckii]MCI1578114.1 PTS sugar transporter subunit IIB [Clostridium beijerinckii]MCI1583003.1 PTS sugar transporter subunit IIB [Clostridium beijerinckii]MCI1620871.1 PTS sugar transporter subunit IIB [Clostridium beijerinckii]